MKRSEAVAIVLRALAGLDVDKPDGYCYITQAEHIINALENAGLLPQNPVGTNWYGSWEKED
jgi:hypothetical protein